ncbi:MAG: S-layer homology domain-containing protein [Bacillota bacterium]
MKVFRILLVILLLFSLAAPAWAGLGDEIGDSRGDATVIDGGTANSTGPTITPDADTIIINASNNNTSSTPFSDINNHWAKAYILDMVDYSVISGFADGTFRPETKVTRAEVAKMLVGATQSNAKVATGDTKVKKLYYPILSATDKAQADVPDWAKPFVGGAVQSGAIKGFADGTFKPDLSVTKVQLAAMLGRLIPDSYAKKVPWKDVPVWAAKDVSKAYGLGAVSGYTDGTFRPNKALTRAEVAKMLDILMRTYNKGA